MSWIETPDKLIVVLDNLPAPIENWEELCDFAQNDKRSHMVDVHVSQPIHAALLGELCWALDHFEELERKANVGVRA